ncbi:MAG: molybdopterin converting factor small subunit [Candidatus Poriferisodalaceae bacterium]|jgi:molybdopterin converting factor small subunit
MITVHFSAELRTFTGDDAELVLEASSVRRLIGTLEQRYPGIGERLRTGTAVAINGEILPDAMFEDIPDGAEVHFLEALSGG